VKSKLTPLLKVFMKRLSVVLILLFCLSGKAQLIDGDWSFSSGLSVMQSDLGDSTSGFLAGSEEGYFVNFTYTWHLYDQFEYGYGMYDSFWGHLLLKGSMNFTQNMLKYDSTSNVDPILIGELPGTSRIQGTSNIYGVGGGMEYHINNLTRYYANRAKFKFSPFVGFALQYNIAFVNTNARLNYDIVYGNGDGVIQDSEVPISAADVAQYNLNYNLNPVPENKLRGSFEQYVNDSAPEGSPRRRQLIRYGGLNRPTRVNAFSFEVSAGSRFYLNERLELAAKVDFRFFSSDDLDGLNLPIKPNSAKESLFNASICLIYHVFK
jgi:hypothetical protein